MTTRIEQEVFLAESFRLLYSQPGERLWKFLERYENNLLSLQGWFTPERAFIRALRGF